MGNWIANFRRLWGGAKPGPADRRLRPRYRMQLPVSIVAGNHTWTAQSCDLSQSGMGLLADAGFEIGDRITLIYELGDGSPLKKVNAIVRNRTGRRYGVEFVK